MNLTDEERLSLVTNRVSRAFQTWEETKGIIQSGYWYAAANRMYYSCYYITSALLIKNGFNASTHNGVIRLFGQYFVSTGIVKREQGRLFSSIFELRQSGDYDDWKLIEAKDILPLIDDVEEYLQTIKALIEQ